jgi:Rrf2 family protein
MKITKWGEYGILCTLCLGAKYSPEDSIGAQEIATLQSIPLQYTHQILQRLKNGGIIESVRGPGGGYRLTRKPEEINLRQILEASEGATFQIMCDLHPIYGDACGAEQVCGLSAVWRELKIAIDSVLEGKTLAELLKVHKFYPGVEDLVNIA